MNNLRDRNDAAMGRDAEGDERIQAALTLLQILELGDGQVAAGKISSASDVVERIRQRSQDSSASR